MEKIIPILRRSTLLTVNLSKKRFYNLKKEKKRLLKMDTVGSRALSTYISTNDKNFKKKSYTTWAFTNKRIQDLIILCVICYNYFFWYRGGSAITS